MPTPQLQDDLYVELAHALALIVYARCVSHDGVHAAYQHFNENRLEIPPDILARLGVMRPIHPDKSGYSMEHVFLDDWVPQKPLHLKRHAGEPSLFDLIVAACLMVDWDQQLPKSVKRFPAAALDHLPALDLKDHMRGQSEPQVVFAYLAFRKAAVCVERLGLGEWNEDGDFSLIHPLLGSSPIDLADTYQVTRHLTAKRLGGVEFLFPRFGEP